MLRTLSLCGLLVATQAQAGLIQIDFSGTRSSASANVFGTDVSQLRGHALYETDTPATLFSTFNGTTNNFYGALRAFSFELLAADGAAVFAGERQGGSFAYAQVRDASAGRDSFSLNGIYLDPDELSGDPAGLTQVQFTLLLNAISADVIDAPSLPQTLDPLDFSQRVVQLFVARTPGSQPSGVAVSLNYNLDTLSFTPYAPVPEPASVMLYGLGLAALLRRKARAAAAGFSRRSRSCDAGSPAAHRGGSRARAA